MESLYLALTAPFKTNKAQLFGPSFKKCLFLNPIIYVKQLKKGYSHIIGLYGKCEERKHYLSFEVDNMTQNILQVNGESRLIFNQVLHPYTGTGKITIFLHHK